MSVADLCYGLDEPARVYMARRQCARKAHTCDECGLQIDVGMSYERASMLYDRWDTFRTCARCLSVRDWVQAHVPCVSWMHGSMLDDMRAFTEQAMSEPDYPAGLHFGLLRRLLACLPCAT